MVLIVLATLFAVEVLALLWLKLTVTTYHNFWVDKAKQPGELTYLALGDSAAQGIGATSPMRGYVGLIAKKLEASTGKKVKVINLSETGATVQDCLRTQVPLIKNVQADIVTIEIGANDVKTNNPEAFRKDMLQLIPQLPAGTFISNMPLFNSRPSSTAPAKVSSKVIEDLVRADGGLHFVDLQKQTTDHRSIFGFAPDLFHPNNLSYKNWYQAFWNEIEPTL